MGLQTGYGRFEAMDGNVRELADDEDHGLPRNLKFERESAETFGGLATVQGRNNDRVDLAQVVRLQDRDKRRSAL